LLDRDRGNIVQLNHGKAQFDENRLPGDISPDIFKDASANNTSALTKDSTLVAESLPISRCWTSDINPASALPPQKQRITFGIFA